MGLRHPHRPSEYPNLLLFILDETHLTVTIITAAVLLWTRDPHVLWFSIGALGSTQLAKGIKLLIREKRPPPPPPESKTSPVRPKKTYGMPSTHSTALSFYHGYLLPLMPRLAIILLPNSARGGTGLLNHAQTRFLLSMALTVSWGLGLWSRVELGYHTWPQVIVGGVIGELLGGGWRVLWARNQRMLEPILQDWIEWGWGLTLGRIF